MELSTIGRSALTDEAKGKKHGDLVVKSKNFFNTKSSEAFCKTKISVMIMREHWNIVSQSESSKAEVCLGIKA